MGANNATRSLYKLAELFLKSYIAQKYNKDFQDP